MASPIVVTYAVDLVDARNLDAPFSNIITSLTLSWSATLSDPVIKLPAHATPHSDITVPKSSALPQATRPTPPATWSFTGAYRAKMHFMHPLIPAGTHVPSAAVTVKHDVVSTAVASSGLGPVTTAPTYSPSRVVKIRTTAPSNSGTLAPTPAATSGQDTVWGATFSPSSSDF
jgi:hypothetical protein